MPFGNSELIGQKEKILLMGSVVGVMELIMSLEVLKSIYFESCEL